jgi:DNA-binding SARP family transcriptional activator/WD40 repeat protein
MGIAVLGPVEVDGQANGLSPRDRVVLSALVVRAHDPSSTEALADALWGDDLPASWAKVVHGCVARLRKRLGAAAIESGAAGYRLTVNETEVDSRRFERLFERGRDALTGSDPERASFLVREALELWRGRALADLEEWEPGRAEAARLEGLRRDAEELLVEAETRAGRARDVVERARALVGEAPYRERRWALLAVTLHQAGRQAEALAALKRARTMLVDELGLDPGRELVELEEQLLRQDPALAPVLSREVSGSCPYRGLLPYSAEDADSFFGREADVAACLRKLRDARVLAVVGPSGIGKSSLVRAGVVAALTRSGTRVLVTTPGDRPTESLLGLKARGRQTLVVDQAEEAVTACADTEERERYFAALAAHVAAGGALVLSMRTDHLGDLAPYPHITRLLEDGLHLLGPMSEPDLRNAIEGPARRSGLRLEPGLVDVLVQEVEGEPAALPMLSHVLRATWERREGPTLTVEGYRATGGIRSAVSQTAETLYEAIDPSQRSRLRTLLLRLVMPTEDGDAVRTRVPRSRVAADDEHQELVEQLVSARLVSTDGDTVQIAHEALVRGWPRLRGWLDDDVDGQRLFRHLTGAADAWDAMGRPDSELYRGARLARTLEWRDRTAPDLSGIEEAFLLGSIALSESELRAAEARVRREHRINRRLRGALAAVAALAVLALVAGVLAVRTADRARDDRDRADTAATLADARRAAAQALVDEDPQRALLLAASALQVDTSPEAWEKLAATLQRNPTLLAVRDAGGAVVDLAASPDGALVAASRPGLGDGPRPLLLLDAATQEPLDFPEAPPASGIAFSPDGRLLAMAVNQWNGDNPPRIDAQPVRLYEMPSGTLAERQLRGFPEGGAVEYALDFSADGRRLVAEVQDYDAATGEFDTESAATVWNLARPRHPIFRVKLPEYQELELSPDGRLLYVALTGDDRDRPIRVYDIDSGRLLRSTGSRILNEIGAFAADLSPDGSTFAVATASEVYRYDTRTLQIRGRDLEAGAGDYVDRLEFSHDGSQLAGATRDGQLVVWGTASGVVRHRFAEPGVSWGISFSADDRTLLSSGQDAIRSWDLTGQRGLFSLGKASDTAEYAVSSPAPDGRTLVRERLGEIWFVDNVTGRETPKTRKATHDFYHLFSPDSRWLLTWRSGASIRLWDTQTATLVGSRPFPEDGGPVFAWSPAGDQVYLAVTAGTRLLVLERATLEPLGTPIGLPSKVLELHPHPEDGTLYAITQAGAVLRVDPGAGEVEQVANPGTFPPASQSLVLSPDGTRFVAVNPGEQLQLLDVTTWTWFGPAFDWGDDWFLFSPDGSQVAHLEDDRLTLRDGRTGERQASIPLPSVLPAARMAYLPDGSGIVIAGVDGRTWTVETRLRSWLERACRTAGRNLSRDEWREYFPTRPYEATCPEWPAGA